MNKNLHALTVALLLTLTLEWGSSAQAEVRSFTSAAGTGIRGEFDTINGDMVTIKKEDGKLITTRAANFSAADQAYLKEHGLKDPGSSGDLAGATKDKPFVNSLGMKFVPVPGTKVLFCTTLTRGRDFDAFASEVPGMKPTGAKNEGPVDAVSWNTAKAFCDWLSKKEARSYRLPTDREWSYAVGIGSRESATATPEELNGKIKDVYPWGTQWPPPSGGAGNYMDETFKAYCKTIKAPPPKEYIKGYTDGQFAISEVQALKPDRLGLHDIGGKPLAVV